MPPSYAVLWREASGSVCSGELEFHEGDLRLEGAVRSGAPAARSVGYVDIAGARIGRSVHERLDGRPTLILELHRGSSILLAGVESVALHHEIAERLASALTGGSGA